MTQSNPLLERIRPLIEAGQLAQSTLDTILSHCTSNPNDAECMYIAGLIYETKDNIPQAIQAYTSATQTNHLPSQVRLLYHNIDSTNPLALLQYAHQTSPNPDLINKILENKDNSEQRKELRLQLTPLLKQQPDYHQPIWRTAQALALQHDYAIAEELGIAVANASNESKYWQFVGDIVMQSPYANRPKSIQWAQQCYQKAQQLAQK